MYCNIDVVKENNDLEQEWFNFYFDDRDCILLLNGYIKANRESKRHKFKPILTYDRLSLRKNNIKVIDVPLTEEIRKQALDKFISIIRVMTSDECQKERVRKMSVNV